jgi:hypothetical protein
MNIVIFCFVPIYSCLIVLKSKKDEMEGCIYIYGHYLNKTLNIKTLNLGEDTWGFLYTKVLPLGCVVLVALLNLIKRQQTAICITLTNGDS